MIDFNYDETLLDSEIAYLLKAIKRLHSYGRERLGGVTNALEKLKPGQKLIIQRFDPVADEAREEAARKRHEERRAALKIRREQEDAAQKAEREARKR